MKGDESITAITGRESMSEECHHVIPLWLYVCRGPLSSNKGVEGRRPSPERTARFRFPVYGPPPSLSPPQKEMNAGSSDSPPAPFGDDGPHHGACRRTLIASQVSMHLAHAYDVV